jgi:GMP synthase (glutamine-hydrolysing)
MKKLYIVKTGTSFTNTIQQFGDFDQWTLNAMGDTSLEISIIDITHDYTLPKAAVCAGVVITGSHAMVTDELSWSVDLEGWIRTLLDEEVPFFGICYGHQLLAKAAGGKVDFHPEGLEIGTVEIRMSPEYVSDPVFGSLPSSFPVHVTHSQTVLRLPEEAINLAGNDFEPNHIFRIGRKAYGVQFHPEYTTDIMKSYIEEQVESISASGRKTSEILNQVQETPVATDSLKHFCRLVEHTNE